MQEKSSKPQHFTPLELPKVCIKDREKHFYRVFTADNDPIIVEAATVKDALNSEVVCGIPNKVEFIVHGRERVIEETMLVQKSEASDQKPEASNQNSEGCDQNPEG